MFVIDREAIYGHERIELVDDIVPIEEHLNDLEEAINDCFVSQGITVVQSGRVIALRATDEDRLSSAFKAALYLGKYNDMDNKSRFLKKMVAAGHSYEPIRGENILFLYIGVGKPVYDHMVTYTVGRPTRIAGGQRANLPWGYEVPSEAKDDVTDGYMKLGIEQVRNVVNLTKNTDENDMAARQQIQVARSLLPVGYIMPPFLLEFTEEALIRTVFRQRLWEKGAQGATVDIVADMWNCVVQLDKEKWETLLDYHGPDTQRWEKAMRTLRDKNVSVGEFILSARKQMGLPEPTAENAERSEEDLQAEYEILMGGNLHDILMSTVGKMPPSMWEKMK